MPLKKLRNFSNNEGLYFKCNTSCITTSIKESSFENSESKQDCSKNSCKNA